MKISEVNKLERTLSKFKSSLEGVVLVQGLHPDTTHNQDLELLTQAHQRLSELEEILVDLKSNHNSAAAKIIKWAKNDLATLSPDSSELFIFSANESAFNIKFSAAKAFNLNLKTTARGHGFENQAHGDFYFDTVRRNLFSNTDLEPYWANSEDFTDYLTIGAPTLEYPHLLNIEFKYSKRLVKDPAIMNNILSDLVTQLWDHCKYLSK